MKKLPKYIIIISTVLFIATFVIENSYFNGNRDLNYYPNYFHETIQSSYTPRGPLVISSNFQFDSIATSLGWDGTGDEASPYIIEGYSFTGAYQLIDFKDTDKYFILRDNLINGENFLLDGVYFINVANGIVYNNTIINNRHGIFLDTDCLNNKIQNNTIYNSAQSGIRLNHTDFNQIIENEVYDNIYNGIWLNSSNNNIIHNNSVYNHENGIWLRDDSDYNNLTFNTITDVENSILLSNFSSDNTLLGNYLTNNTQCGIKLTDYANFNDVLNNTIESLISYGAILNFSTHNNTFSFNNFIDNNGGGTSQAYDNGTDNIFEYNYWNNWTIPDISPPYGIVDDPFDIDGLSSNEDPFPLTFLVSTEVVHIINAPKLYYPNGGEIVNGSALIQWVPSSDSFSHEILYTIFYSSNGGSDWEEIISNLDSTSFIWDTSQMPRGSDYKIRIIANCSEGLISGDDSDGTFSIQDHTLSSPIILNPTESQVIEGILNIIWTQSVDSWEDDVTYSIFYSNDSQNWIEIASDLSETNFLWNTSDIEDGSQYQIKIIANTSDNFFVEVSSGSFSIDNGIIEQPSPGFDLLFVIIVAAVAGVTALVIGLLSGFSLGTKRATRSDESIQPVKKHAAIGKKKPVKEEIPKETKKVKPESSVGESKVQNKKKEISKKTKKVESESSTGEKKVQNKEEN